MLNHAPVIALLEQALSNARVRYRLKVISQRRVRHAEARGDTAQHRLLEVSKSRARVLRIVGLEVYACGQLVKRARLHIHLQRTIAQRAVCLVLIAAFADEESHLASRYARGDQFGFFVSAEHLESRHRGSRPRRAARLPDAIRAERVQHTICGNSDFLVRLPHPYLVIVGMPRADVVRNRSPCRVNFNAHPYLVPVRQDFVLVLVDQVGIDKLQPKPIRVGIVLNE